MSLGAWLVWHGRPPDAVVALRPARSASERWLLGVALGASGRYGAAFKVLAPLTDRSSYAASTLASLHRQLGRHASARPLDERASTLATTADEACDAQLGLAADAVGMGDASAARAHYDRAIPLAGDRWRSRVRVGWVGAELSLLTGRPAEAVPPAAAAVAAALAAGAPRHLAKSLLFLGVAAATSPDALATLRRAAGIAAGIGALPLVWPACAVLAAAGEDPERWRRRGAAAVRRIAADLSPTEAAAWTARPDVAVLLADRHSRP